MPLVLRSGGTAFPTPDHERDARQEPKEGKLRHAHPKSTNKHAKRDHGQEGQDAADGVRESPDHRQMFSRVDRLRA